ncbi:MAG: glycosyltransferase family 4 protein [Acidimicrobiales bacterium]|nr:glycosyltransferase family 4 protein [Acidimicrobiales bacterium]HRW36939.1 glycosyltransferase family 1 protein [Aquihabitans sp.]
MSVDARGPRRIGVNLLWLVPGVVGGSEEYTTRLLRGLAEARPSDLRLTLFALAPFVDAHPDLAAAYPTVTTRIDGHRKAERVAYEATWLARQAAGHSIDLLHHAGGVVPPGPAVGRIRSALTVHDLQPLVMPENFSATKRRWLATMLPRSVRRAAAVFTPSDPTGAQVVSRLGIDRARVRTVPHGIEPPTPVPPARVADVRARYRLGEQVVLYPAITYAHKDHRTLVAAFARLARSRPEATLVLTGGAGPVEGEVVAAIRSSGVGHQVRRTGRIPADDLRALYAAASVVAVPSRFEGFGAPALEAMAAGVPVVVSDATALPWVVGDAGLKVPPGDVERWCGALARVLDQPTVAATLAAAGRVRAASFTWDRAAGALAAGYRAALDVGETGVR